MALNSVRVGDIVATEKDVASPLTLSIQGQQKFHCQPGAFKGRKAIEVGDPIEEKHILIEPLPAARDEVA